MELKPISHFFNNRIYIVPPYQRGFSWGKKQITELLNDIRNSIQLETEHYMGTITIQKHIDSERIGLTLYDKYNIVDGQQRFTSLIILVTYLIKKLKYDENLINELLEKESKYIKKNDKYLFRYEIDDVSGEYLRTKILEQENMASLDENLYTRNMSVAKKSIIEYFKESINKGKELNFLEAIENRLKFNEYIVNSTADIGVLFETMNNRGIPLSDLEIVKNRLLYLATKAGVVDEENNSEATIENINSKWAIILKNLTLPDRVLDENKFLSNHWIIYSGWSKDNRAKIEILDKEFTIEKLIESPSNMLIKVKDYVNSLATTSLHWRFINFPEGDNSFSEIENSNIKDQIKEVFSQLNILSNSTVRPLLLSFFGLMTSSPSKLLELAKLAEIFSFRLFSMNRKRSDTGKNDIYRHCNEFYKNYDNENGINKAIGYLAWYIDNHGDSERFSLETKELFSSSKKDGYYSWNGLVYFLYDYEKSISQGQDMKVSFDFANKKTNSIEHILPQNYPNHWGNVVGNLNEDEMKQYLHSLGNLVLISANKNSALKDSSYIIKRESFRNGSYSEIKIATSNEDWNLETIKNREVLLLEYLTERWELGVKFQEKYNLNNETTIEITDDVLDDIEETP